MHEITLENESTERDHDSSIVRDDDESSASNPSNDATATNGDGKHVTKLRIKARITAGYSNC